MDNKMNPEVKQEWLKALRSGEYTQGRNVLKSNNTFCCLGVLCDLHAKHTNAEWKSVDRAIYGFNAYSYEGAELTLPPEVMQWAGLPSNNVEVDGNTLTFRNDHKKMTFSEIADVIEEHL
jgi:hypothetical protein